MILSIAAPLPAERRYFVSALGGITSLSGDARTDFSQALPRVALYDPKSGAGLNLAGGVHVNDWFALQGSYIWSRNDVTLAEIQGPSFQERRAEVRQAALGADGLLYFRPRSSRIRPYLSVGPSAVHIRPADGGRSWHPGLRVAVGIDLLTKNGWAFRYSFSEMLTANAINAALSPPGGRRLMTFQNLFGVCKYF